jgi:hypothetical protein
MLESLDGRTLFLKDDQHALLQNREKMRVEYRGSDMNSASMVKLLGCLHHRRPPLSPHRFTRAQHRRFRLTVGRRFRLTASRAHNTQQLRGGNASSCWRLSQLRRAVYSPSRPSRSSSSSSLSARRRHSRPSEQFAPLLRLHSIPRS